MAIARWSRPSQAAVALAVALGCPIWASAADAQVSVYSSVGVDAAGRAAERGIKLALKERNATSGGLTIRYVALTNARDPAGNAHAAAADPSTVAYIGELDSIASAVSMPTLNGQGIAQIAPSNAAIGLTRGGPGARPGEPGKHYPTGRRHFFRLMPSDRVHGAALASLMRQDRCRRIAVITDGEVVGKGLGYWLRRSAPPNRLRVVFSRAMRPNRRSYRDLSSGARRRRAQCVAYTGTEKGGAPRLLGDLARTLPRAKLFGTHWLDTGLDRLPARVLRRILLTSSALDRAALPRAGRDFYTRYRLEYGERDPHPYAVYGFESMSLILDGVAGGGGSRNGLIDWLGRVNRRPSVLGTYGFDRYGDISLKDYSVFSFDGRFSYFEGTVRPRGR